MILRPEFTVDLAEQLLAGRCIHLLSPHGLGRRRTLTDLHTLLSHTILYQIDIKRFEGDQQSWFEGTYQQLLLRTEEAVLIVHNYERLKNKVSKQLLFKLKAFQHVGMLCVSEHVSSHNILGFELVSLPNLTKVQWLAELKDREFPIVAGEHSRLADWLLEQGSPYSFLDQVTSVWFKRELWK